MEYLFDNRENGIQLSSYVMASPRVIMDRAPLAAITATRVAVRLWAEKLTNKAKGEYTTYQKYKYYDIHSVVSFTNKKEMDRFVNDDSQLSELFYLCTTDACPLERLQIECMNRQLEGFDATYRVSDIVEAKYVPQTYRLTDVDPSSKVRRYNLVTKNIEYYKKTSVLTLEGYIFIFEELLPNTNNLGVEIFKRDTRAHVVFRAKAQCHWLLNGNNSPKSVVSELLRKNNYWNDESVYNYNNIGNPPSHADPFTRCMPASSSLIYSRFDQFYDGLTEPLSNLYPRSNFNVIES